MAIWQATNVSIPNNSSIITVNTGDDVGNLFTGAIVQVNNLQFMTVKTVNTGASPQTIEIDELYTGSAVSGGTAIGAPTQGTIKEAAEELRLLRTTYENLADTVSTTGTANSLAKRTSAGRLKAADGSAVDDVVTLGQFESLETYGEWGIGTAGAPCPNDNADEAVESGIYRTTSSTTNTGLTGTAVIIVGRSFNLVSQINISGTVMYIRRSTDSGATWTDWREVYHSGNSVNPLDYGIGPTDDANPNYLSDDADTLQEGASLQVITSASPFFPPDVSGGAIRLWGNFANQDYGWFIGASSGKIVFNTKYNGSWAGWAELHHSRNSVNPLDYDMAGSTGLVRSAPNNNLDEVEATSIVRADDANDKPDAVIGEGGTNSNPGMILHVNRYQSASAQTSSQLCFGHDNSANKNSALWHRSISGTNGPNPWRLVHDSANTNFSKWTMGTGKQKVGFGRTSSIIQFEFDIAGINQQPTGATFSGAVDIIDLETNTTVISGTQLTYSPTSSDRLIILEKTGLSGITSGRAYRVVVTSLVEISVDF